MALKCVDERSSFPERSCQSADLIRDVKYDPWHHVPSAHIVEGDTFGAVGKGLMLEALLTIWAKGLRSVQQRFRGTRVGQPKINRASSHEPRRRCDQVSDRCTRTNGGTRPRENAVWITGPLVEDR